MLISIDAKKAFDKIQHPFMIWPPESRPGFWLNWQLFWLRGLPAGSDSKESACSAGDPGSVCGSGRSPGEGNGYPLQYPCLENSMDRGAWKATGVAKSQTLLSDYHFHFLLPWAKQLVTKDAQRPPEKPMETCSPNQPQPLPGVIFKLLYNPAILLLGIYLEKTIIWNNICTPIFIASLSTITKTWKQSKCPLIDDRKRRCGMYLEHHSAIKKKWNNAICSNMDGPKNYHTKCSKPAKGKQISYDIAYVWNLK